MNEARLDNQWRRNHPLPPLGAGADKAGRGRVLVVGGSLLSPGAVRLAAEASLRAGAGKVRIATVEPAALPLGVQVPEAGVIGVPVDAAGEIAPEAAERLREQATQTQVLALGMGMRSGDAVPDLTRSLLEVLPEGVGALLDSAALIALKQVPDAVRAADGRVVLTPHPGELAALLDLEEATILDDMAHAAREAAQRFGTIVALKSAATIIASPDGALLRYENDARGLGTAGSGDVLAGIIAGLMARGADPLVATGWGVWLHGEAGQAAASRTGPLGFLARELLPKIPMLMAVQAQP